MTEYYCLQISEPIYIPERAYTIKIEIMTAMPEKTPWMLSQVMMLTASEIHDAVTLTYL